MSMVSQYSDAVALHVTSKLEVVDVFGNVLDDISAHMDPHMSSVSRAMTDDTAVHGTAEFVLDTELNWPTALLAPSIVLRDLSTDMERAWRLGVYTVETPKFKTGVYPAQYTVHGYDLTSKLDYPTGKSIGFDGASNIVASVRSLLADAGMQNYAIDQGNADRALKIGLVWPLSQRTTWRCIIDELLAFGGYNGIYADRDGTLRAYPYVPPQDKTRAAVLDAEAETSVIRHPIDWQTDLYKRPNQWIVYRNDPGQDAPVEGNGIVTLNNVGVGPASQRARGEIIRRVVGVNATTQADLVTQAERIRDRDQWPRENVVLKTTPQPDLWHDDIVSVHVDELQWSNRSCEVQGWTLGLACKDMSIQVSPIR